MKKFLAMILALALALSVTTLSWADTPAEMDLNAFINAVVAANYNYDGNGVTVKWSPVTGCYDTREGHTCTAGNVAATGNTPKRVNNGLTQFQMFEGSNVAVTVKNVNFVYTPDAFTVCINSGWAGTFTADQAPAGQLYFMNSGDFTFENCTFNKVVLTNFNGTGTSKVINCEFTNVYNNYAVKDIRGNNISVVDCSFTDCGAAIMVSSTGDVESVTISNNKFKNIDTARTAPSNKVGTRGLIQLASTGDYTDATITLDKNTATDCGPVLRQLNATVDMTKAAGDMSGIVNANGNLSATSDSVGAAAGEGDGNEIEVPFTPTPEQPPRYYYNSTTTTTTTTTKADGTKGSPKTFDAGMGIYALTAVLSVTGMAYVGKKKF